MTTATSRHRSRGHVAAVAACAVMLTLLPFGLANPAQAQQTFDRGIDRACPDQDTDAFADDDDNVHEPAINCIAFWQITVGLPDGTYGPRQVVTRAQMATFIAKAMRTAGHEFPENPDDAFGDDDDSDHEDNINALAAEGVVRGDGEGNYNPGAFVRRDQMASFINQALAVVTGEAVESDEDFFGDDDGNDHEDNINALASIGVVTGTGGGNYSPGAAVRRDAMASFIARGADFLAEEGHWPVITDITVEPTSAAASRPSSSGTSNTGAREYTVDARGIESVSIALFAAEHVQTAPDGTITIGPDNKPLQEGQGVSIERVNGQSETAAASGEGTTQVDDVEPVEGAVTFTIDSVEELSVVPVVWEDSINPNGNEIDLVDLTHVPKESFGVGGRSSWIPTGASNGDDEGDVGEANAALDYYTFAGEATFDYDSGDVFRFDSSTITMAVFERLAGPGADITVDYSRTGQSVHQITGAKVTEVAWVAAARADTDGDEDRDDVAIHWGAAPAPGVVYDVFRSSDGTLDGSDTRIANGITATRFNDVNQQGPDTRERHYFVVVKEPETNTTSTPVKSNAVSIPGSVQGGGSPSHSGAVLANDAGANCLVDANDSWEITFSDEISVASDASIDILEGPNFITGDSATVTNGENAVFSVAQNDDDDFVVTVRITQLVTADNGALISYWVQMTDSSGITATGSGEEWSPGGEPGGPNAIGESGSPNDEDNEKACG